MNEETTTQNEVKLARAGLDKAIAEADNLATNLEKRSQAHVRTSMLFDVVTVLFSVASPALTTFVAFNKDSRFLNLGMILVVSVAVSLPTIKRLLGIKTKALQFSKGAFDLRGAVSRAHDETRRTDEDVKEEKKAKYFDDQGNLLRARISEVRQHLNATTFVIMNEATELAEKRAAEIASAANKAPE